MIINNNERGICNREYGCQTSRLFFLFFVCVMNVLDDACDQIIMIGDQFKHKKESNDFIFLYVFIN